MFGCYWHDNCMQLIPYCKILKVCTCWPSLAQTMISMCWRSVLFLCTSSKSLLNLYSLYCHLIVNNNIPISHASKYYRAPWLRFMGPCITWAYFDFNFGILCFWGALKLCIITFDILYLQKMKTHKNTTLRLWNMHLIFNINIHLTFSTSKKMKTLKNTVTRL